MNKNTNKNTERFSYIGALIELARPHARRDDSGALRLPRGNFESALLTRAREMANIAARGDGSWRDVSSYTFDCAVKALRVAGASGAVALGEEYRDHCGDFPAYTSMGCYPIVYVGDGWCVCAECANALDQDPDADTDNPITAAGPNYEDPSLYCDHCSERIESAYAEDQYAADCSRDADLTLTNGMQTTGGSFCEGTIHVAPRIREMRAWCDYYAHDAYMEWLESTEYTDDDDDADDENADGLLDELIELASAYLPDGWYFGNHPGDGADFGLWRDDSDE